MQFLGWLTIRAIPSSSLQIEVYFGHQELSQSKEKSQEREPKAERDEVGEGLSLM